MDEALSRQPLPADVRTRAQRRALQNSPSRLIDFRIKQNLRAAQQIRTMISESEKLVAHLDREIRSEEARTGTHDPAHFAYSTVAKAAMLRRDNLRHSIDILRSQLEQAENALRNAVEERAAWPSAESSGDPGPSRSDAA